MSALVSRGYQAPTVAGGGGGGGPSGITVTFALYNADGELAAGVDLDGAISVRAPGEAFSAAAGTWFDGGGGSYDYTFDPTETGGAAAILKVEKAAHRVVLERVDLAAAQKS